MIAGGSQEEVTAFKREEVVQKVSESVQIHGPQPGLLAGILRRAIAVLKEFLDLLMQSVKEEPEVRETGKSSSRTGSELHEKQKSEHPDSRDAEFRFMRIESVHQKLYKTNRKLYALQKQKETVQLALDHKPKSILHRRECKELQERIDGLERQITFCRNQLFLIPDANGFASVREAEQEYHAAKKALEQVRRAQAKWDGIITQDEKNIEQPKSRTQKLSVLKQLAEKQAETSERNINHADTKVYRKEASL